MCAVPSHGMRQEERGKGRGKRRWPWFLSASWYLWSGSSCYTWCHALSTSTGWHPLRPRTSVNLPSLMFFSGSMGTMEKSLTLTLPVNLRQCGKPLQRDVRERFDPEQFSFSGNWYYQSYALSAHQNKDGFSEVMYSSNVKWPAWIEKSMAKWDLQSLIPGYANSCVLLASKSLPVLSKDLLKLDKRRSLKLWSESLSTIFYSKVKCCQIYLCNYL